jgi:hypothetical protein
LKATPCVALLTAALWLACNNDRPEIQAPRSDQGADGERAGSEQAGGRDATALKPPRDASAPADSMAEESVMTKEERLAEIERRVQIQEKVRAWAGPEYRVTPRDEPTAEGLSFFVVRRDNPRAPRIPQYGRGVAWDHEADAPLEGDALMRAVIARTEDPSALAEAALLAYYPEGQLAEAQRVPDRQRELWAPPEVSGEALRFLALRPRARGRDLWRIELKLDTLEHDAQRAEDL